MKTIIPALLLTLSAIPAIARPALQPELSGLRFLLGQWSSTQGQVADTGGTDTGTFTIESAADGAALLRRDHTNLFDRAGKPTGSFDQVMLIYPEAHQLHADYLDGTHIIHYVTATVTPGKSVTFQTASPPNAPNFHLTYTLVAPATLNVSFQIAPPGTTTFHPIATGFAKKLL